MFTFPGKINRANEYNRISVQAPQIVGWVQTLMPQLPKPKDGPSKMVGLF
jgi:hypothetical protein